MNTYENHWLDMPEPPDDVPDTECSVCHCPLWYDAVNSEEQAYEVEYTDYCHRHKPKEDEDE